MKCLNRIDTESGSAWSSIVLSRLAMRSSTLSRTCASYIGLPSVQPFPVWRKKKNQLASLLQLDALMLVCGISQGADTPIDAVVRAATVVKKS